MKISLKPAVVPHESVDKNYKADGYDGVVVHDTVKEGFLRTMPDCSRRRHPYTDLACGTFLYPDAPHKSNQREHYRRNYACLSTCEEIADTTRITHGRGFICDH